MLKNASQIKPGDTLVWEEVTCPHRGYVKNHRVKVVSRRGNNLETESGDWLWWPNIKRWKPSIESASEAKPPTT